MPTKIRKYHKRGGFLENFTKSMNSGVSNISSSSKGALDTINKSANDAGNSIGNFFSSGYDKVFGNKNSTSSMPSSSSYSNSSYSNSLPTTTNTSLTSNSSISSSPSSNILSSNYSSTVYGGRRRKHGTKKMYRGGSYVSNTNLNNLASNALPISGIKTAQPSTWVGGKRKSRKGRKSRKTRKTRK